MDKELNELINYFNDESRELIIKELKRHGILKKNRKTAVEMTKDDIKLFHELIKQIKDQQLPEESKQEAIFIIKIMQMTLNRMKSILTDREFAVFYSLYFQKQSIRKIAFQFGIDEGTVKRIGNKALEKMAIYLHPETVLVELIS